MKSDGGQKVEVWKGIPRETNISTFVHDYPKENLIIEKFQMQNKRISQEDLWYALENKLWNWPDMTFLLSWPLVSGVSQH